MTNQNIIPALILQIPNYNISLNTCNSFSFSFLAPPSSPMGLHNTSILITSFSITWTPPSDTGGHTDIFYIVIITSRSINITVNITDTQYSVTGLNPSTTYTVSVRAGNGVSDQDSSNDDNRTVSIIVTTPNSGPTKPLDVNLGTSQVS